jgi:glycosyltransferase involved in cell wall biosynthesis
MITHLHGKVSEILPVVSVIMNCYNGERYLQEAIDSVYTQTFSDWEIILWDDASKDRTAEIAKSYDEKLRYFKGEKATALGQARNWAIDKARGEFIAFLDQDDVWLCDKLSKQIPIFEDPAVGIVISNTLFFDGNGKERQFYQKHSPPTGYVFRELLSKYFISLETVVLRAQSLTQLDKHFNAEFTAIEEYDLLVRISYNWKVAYVKDVLSKWRVHAASWTWSKKDSFPKEKRIMLAELSNIIPEFDSEYSEEIKVVKRGIAIQESEILWANGQSQAARELVKINISDDLRCKIFYLLTFFPYTLYTCLRKISGRISPL